MKIKERKSMAELVYQVLQKNEIGANRFLSFPHLAALVTAERITELGILDEEPVSSRRVENVWPLVYEIAELDGALLITERADGNRRYKIATLDDLDLITARMMSDQIEDISEPEDGPGLFENGPEDVGVMPDPNIQKGGQG